MYDEKLSMKSVIHLHIAAYKSTVLKWKVYQPKDIAKKYMT